MTKIYYAVLALALVFMTGSLLTQYVAENEPVADAFYADIQPIDAEEAIDERNALIRAGENPAAPAEYYALLDRAEALKWRVEKTLRQDRYSDPQRTHKLQVVLEATGGANNIMLRFQQNFREKFGMNALIEAGKPWQGTRKVRTVPSAPLSPYAWRWYLISLLLAMAFCLVRAHENGLQVWLEILQPSHLVVAVVAWPVFAWGYPRHSPKQQMIHAMRFATATLGALLSLGAAGTAKAADGKDGSKRERKGKHSLQLDLRAAETVGGASAPEGFGRATLTHANGYFFESVNVVKPKFWLTSDTLGRPLAKGRLGVVNGVAGIVATSTGSRSAQASLQVFGGTKHFGIAFPVLGAERQWSPIWTTTLATTGQVFAKPTARLRVGVEGSVRKTPGAKASWYIGGLVGWSFGKGRPAVEGFILHNSAGAERARARMVHTFAF